MVKWNLSYWDWESETNKQYNWDWDLKHRENNMLGNGTAHCAPFLLLYHTVNPCQNGGTCTEAEDGVTYSCQCPDWFEGFKCEKRFEKGETDHKPLVPILGAKNLEEMSPRIQRLRMHLFS
ncbi:hypothetical protein ACROYT_G041121 [Oculina patagonica]